MVDLDLIDVQSAIETEIAKAVIGQREAQRLMLIGLLTGGHVLLEGPPGTAKTLLCRAFAKATSLAFKRVQFTPDLMPADVLGSNVFNLKSNTFDFQPGPAFTDLLLADEVNRTPPKTQSALLEAMNERSVTIDGETRDLGAGFMVIATQNPIEQQGTYPLPEAQLDRFLFMHEVGYPSRSEEIAIVTGRGPDALQDIRPVLGLAAIVGLRSQIAAIHLSPEIAGYVVDLIAGTRRHPALSFGASPRAAVVLAAAAKAAAALDGRDFVIPDDVKDLTVPVLRHRVIVSPSAEIDGRDARSVVVEIVERVEAPK